MQSSSPVSRFAVWVEFQIRDGAMPDFMSLMLANAEASLAREKGCLQFEVMLSQQSGDTVFLYELYDSQQAFTDHLDSAHFKQFAAATAEMVASRKIVNADLVPGSPGRKPQAQSAWT